MEGKSNYSSEILFSTDLNESDSKGIKIPKNVKKQGMEKADRKISDISEGELNKLHKGAISFNFNRSEVILNLNHQIANQDNKNMSILQEAMYYKRLANECSNKKNFSKSIEYYKKCLECFLGGGITKESSSISEEASGGDSKESFNKDNIQILEKEKIEKEKEHLDFLNQDNIQNLRIDCMNNIAVGYLAKKVYLSALDYTNQVSLFLMLF